MWIWLGSIALNYQECVVTLSNTLLMDDKQQYQSSLFYKLWDILTFYPPVVAEPPFGLYYAVADFVAMLRNDNFEFSVCCIGW